MVAVHTDAFALEDLRALIERMLRRHEILANARSPWARNSMSCALLDPDVT